MLLFFKKRLPMRPGSSRPAPNDPSLLAACQRDDYDMVRYKKLA